MPYFSFDKMVVIRLMVDGVSDKFHLGFDIGSNI